MDRLIITAVTAAELTSAGPVGHLDVRSRIEFSIFLFSRNNGPVVARDWSIMMLYTHLESQTSLDPLPGPNAFDQPLVLSKMKRTGFQKSQLLLRSSRSHGNASLRDNQ